MSIFQNLFGTKLLALRNRKLVGKIVDKLTSANNPNFTFLNEELTKLCFEQDFDPIHGAKIGQKTYTGNPTNWLINEANIFIEALHHNHDLAIDDFLKMFNEYNQDLKERLNKIRKGNSLSLY